MLRIPHVDQTADNDAKQEAQGDSVIRPFRHRIGLLHYRIKDGQRDRWAKLMEEKISYGGSYNGE